MSQYPTEHARIASDVLSELESAWNDADGVRYGNVFTPDADFVDIRGSHHQGAAAIGHGHQGIFATIYAGSTVDYTARTTAQVAPEVILGIVESTLDAPSGPLQGVHRSTATVLLLRDNGAWKIRSFHNTLVAT
jgi:uncharacterized protein (TIGR02246 family)